MENSIIEKSITEQIIDTMIEKLKKTENFSEAILNKLRTSDLTNKQELLNVISINIQGK